MARSVHVICDSSGSYVVALVDPGQDGNFWPSWRLDPDEGVYGPNLVGNWLRFIPSDWHEAAEPFPDRVRQVVDWAATSAELHEFLGSRGRAEWMLNPDAPQPPGAA